MSNDLKNMLDRLVAHSLRQQFKSAQQAQAFQERTSGAACIPTDSAVAPMSYAQTIGQATSAPELTLESVCLAGHSGNINALALHPGGTLLASAGDDKTVRLWDLTTQQPVAVLTGSQASVRSLDFSWDGERLASAGDDQQIRLWNWRTQDTIAVLRGHTASVRSIKFGPEPFLLSGSWDKSIKLWRLDTCSLAATWSGHKLQVNAVAWSPDGQLIASASCDRTVRLWQFSDGAAAKLRATLADHIWSVAAVAFSCDGQILATGSDDNTVKLWHAPTGTLLHSLAHSWTVAAVAFSPDGNLLVSGSWDKTVKLWSLSGVEIGILLGAADAIQAIAIVSESAPAGYRIIAGGRDRLIHLWHFQAQ